jgi:ectoine hydroxylase-related dioxygenase (phytanoyl-CoA dioxygenase family)
MSDAFRSMFDRNGYAVARRLFSVREAGIYREHFTALRLRGSYPHDLVGAAPGAGDPLRRYPRMAHMHRWDETALLWLLDGRIAARLRRLLDAEPYAVQSMLYFKPPGARGQALHQDNFFLRAQPGTCVAAWMALDQADTSNGCLRVVPGSHRWPILCATQADLTDSFADVTVPLPPGTPVHPVLMRPGDVLFFNGSLVHGSAPNSSPGRFRRSLIGHYVYADVRQIASYYHPALDMNGTPVTLETSSGGGPCGQWAEHRGVPAIEMTGTHHASQATE